MNEKVGFWKFCNDSPFVVFVCVWMITDAAVEIVKVLWK